MFRGIATAILVSMAFLVAGCAQTPATSGSVSAGDTAESRAKPTPGLTTRQRLRRSLELLEEGDERQARAELIAYVSDAPRSRTGKSLLRQIDTAPKDYFPPEYREVVLETGQSLSTIAKNYLGSAVQFHALAKYNGIERPRRVVPGQIVRVPLTTEALEIFAGLDDGLDASQADNSSSDEPAADGDLISGTPSGTDSLGGDGSAAEVVGKVLVPESGSIASDVNLPEGAELDASITSLATDAENALIELETEAPEDVPAPLDVDALHRRAITAYRSQDLDTAIALWDEILEADPGYESARLYRSQAKTLKKRLKSLN